MQSDANQQESETFSIQWRTAMPMLTSMIVKSLLFVLLIPTACLLMFLLALALIDGQLTMASAASFTLIALALLIGLFLLGIVSILVFFGNRYDLEFTLTESGVRSSVTGKTKRKNAVINTLLMLSGKPSFAGAGLLAASRQSEFITWDKMDNFVVNPEKREIALRKGHRTLMLLHCPAELYPKIHSVIETNLN